MMMIRKTSSCLPAALLVFAAATAIPALAAGSSDTATGTAQAYVVRPITVTPDGPVLDFGRFAAGGGGTIKVDTDNSEAVSGDVRPVSGNATSAGRFRVTGEPGLMYSITDTVPVKLVNQLDSSAYMYVTLLWADGGNYTLDNNGNATFYVGGRLSVNAGQKPGPYQGYYPVTVAYY